MYLHFCNFARRCGRIVVRERDWDTKGPCSEIEFDPGLQLIFFLFNTNTLNNRLRKGEHISCHASLIFKFVVFVQTNLSFKAMTSLREIIL